MADRLTLAMDTPERVQTRSSGVLCAGCGQAFEPVRPHQRFCRPSCRLLSAFKMRKGKPAPLIEFFEPDPVRPD